MKIIALAGRKGSGKTAVAKMLVKIMESNNQDVEVASFAQPMKEMLTTLGVPEVNLYGTDEDKMKPLDVLSGESARKAMVTLGTEWGRNQMHPDFWVNLMKKKIQELKKFEEIYPKSMPVTFIVDDLRFISEHTMLKDEGATFLGIERGELPPFSEQHVSEHLPYNFQTLGIPTIKNDGSIADLEQKVISFLSSTP